MNQPTPAQSAQVARERAIELAENDSTAIAQLLDSPGWQYLKRRLTERRQQLRDAIADDDTLTDAQTRTARALAKEYADILNLPLQDRAAHLNTIAAHRSKDAGPRRG